MLIFFSVYFWKREDLPKIALFMLIIEFLPQKKKIINVLQEKKKHQKFKNVGVTAFLNLWAEQQMIQEMRK